LVTGAFRNIGWSTVQALLQAGHAVRAFGRPTLDARLAARRLPGTVEVVWGDIRRADDVARVVAGQDVVVHLAAILPPPEGGRAGIRPGCQRWRHASSDQR